MYAILKLGDDMKLGMIILKEEDNLRELCEQLKENEINDMTYFATSTITPKAVGRKTLGFGMLHQMLQYQEDASAVILLILKEQEEKKVDLLLNQWSEKDYVYLLLPMEAIKGSYLG